MLETTIGRRRRRASPYRKALITGASRGIGKAFAQKLPTSTDLLLTARDLSALNAIADDLRTDGRSVEVLAADLATQGGIEAVLDWANAHEPDLFINNAGLARYGAFLDHSFDDQRTTIDVNVTAALALLHGLVPGMSERARDEGERAGVINVASGLAFVPVPTMALYSASKAFLLSFSEALTAELANEPVDVLTLCPGATKTEFGETAGYAGGALLGAMEPGKVAQEAMSALGLQSTLVLGVASKASLTPVALARSAFSKGVMGLSQLSTRRR